MGSQFVKISVKESTKKIWDKCRENYLSYHPELKHVFLSQDKITFEICEFYLRMEKLR